MRNFSITAAALVALALLLLATHTPARALEREQIQSNLRSTVKLLIVDPEEEYFMGGCSGTLLNPEGYILTNFHCVGQTDLYGPDEEYGLSHGELYTQQGLLGVAINENPRELPVLSYIAHFVAGDPDHDVAVVKIVESYDSDVALPEQLPLVTARLGDSDLVDVGDEVSVFGYPGAGGETITFTEGKISGFGDLDGDGSQDWFKTNALINGGNSGGTAVNEEGAVIGIPSASYFDSSRGDALYYIKPLNYAVPTINRALQLGESGTQVGTGGNGDAPAPPSGENFGDVVFLDQDSNESDSFDSGTTEINAYIAYSGMKRGDSWGYIWQLDGEDAIVEDALRWTLGASGELELGIYNDEGALPDGSYTLQILYKGRLAQEAGFTIGDGGSTDEPTPPPAAEDEGVMIAGTVVDMDSGAPIEGAMILFLQPGVTTSQYLSTYKRDQEAAKGLIQAIGISDEDGYFFCIGMLPRGEVYSALVGANGYQPLVVDDALEIYEDDPDYVELNPIGLERK